MPELPEVETIARTLRPQVENRVITAVRVLLPKTLAAGEGLLTQALPAEIRAVRRRAKLLLLDLGAPGSSGITHILAFHLKMTGRLTTHAAEAEPGKHTRLVFDLAPARTGGGNSLPSRLFYTRCPPWRALHR